MNASIVRVSVVAVIISALAFSLILYNPLGTTPKTVQQPAVNTQSATVTYTLGNSTSFGNSYFEPPSEILVAANTLVWTNFNLVRTGSSQISGAFFFFGYPETIGANVTILTYFSGELAASSSYVIPSNHEVTNASQIPASMSPNSIVSLNGVTATLSAGVIASSQTLNSSSTISFALVSNSPIWLAGWSKADMAAGTGPQYGQSIGQLSGTSEYSLASDASFPETLPTATTSISFQLQISGDLIF